MAPMLDAVSARPRESPWPTVPMDVAVRTVRQETFRTEAEARPALTSDIVGYYVASDVLSPEAVPNFRASIMDGYAVVAADGPGVYPVIDAVTAGATPAFRLTRGRVVRITTGAAVPDGADAVVMVEATRLASTTEGGKEATVEILRDVRPGENIRNVGADVSLGDVVLNAGDRIGAVERGLLASLGIQQVVVHRRPVVAVMSTGDELVDADAVESPRRSQIRDSNRPTLLQLIREADCTTLDLGIVRDQAATLRTTFEQGLAAADVVVTSGGVSMGETDLVKPVLQALGATVHFGRVLMKPGKPTTFATLQYCGARKLVFALPGNPASSAVGFHLFVQPALRYMAGARHPDPPIVPVQLLERWPLDARPEYVRVQLQPRTSLALPDAVDATAAVVAGTPSPFVASRTGGQLSSRLMSMRSANGLLILPGRTEARAEIQAGDVVKAVVIGPLQGAALSL